MNVLAPIIETNPTAVLTDPKAYSDLYASILAEVETMVPDTASDKGRKEIKSLAYKVTRTKTAIDDAGKKLNEEARAQINAVDAQRRKIREELDALAAQARKPLTDWEEEEERRVEHFRSLLNSINDLGRGLIGGKQQPYPDLFSAIEAIVIDRSWGEFETEGRIAHTAATERLQASHELHRRAEADRIELERLRAIQAERDRRDAEEAAVRKAEQDRVAAEKAEADRKVAEEAAAKRREEEAAERARSEEKRRAEAAIADAERRARESEERAERERADAAAEQKRLAEEQAAREADREHRSKVMTSVKEALMAQGAAEGTARKIVLAIMAGEIPNTILRF